MKKKYIIIAIVISLLLLVSVMLLANNKKDDNSSFGSMTKDNYYVEKGVEKPADVAKKAIEAYLNQDKSESKDSRQKRLSQYFAVDSPVYQNELDMLYGSVDKSTATTKSVVTCEEQEGTLCLIVSVDIKLYSGSKYEKSSSRYWISIKEVDKGYKVYNLGIEQS